MELEEKVARFQEIERRGLLDRLTPRQQAGWAEYKRRHNLPDYQTKEETFDWSKVTPEMREQIAANNRDYDNQSYAGRIAKDAVTGAGEGVVSGLYNAANGATLGGVGWLDRKTGGNFSALDERLQRRADETGVGMLNRAAKLTAEIGGNVAGAGGAITKGVMKGTAALSKAGIPVVSKVAGGTVFPMVADATIQGSIYGATESDSLDEVAGNTARGAVGGAVTSVALRGIVKALGRFGGLFRKDPQKAMDDLRKQLGDDAVDALIQEAKDSGRLITEVINDPKAIKIAQRARMQTEAADDMIAKSAQNFRENQINRNDAFVDDMFGQPSGYEMRKQATEAAKREAKPYYDALEGRDLAEIEIQERLSKIKPERYREVTPQMGLTPDEYANIVQQQADELGVNISKGNPEKVNNGVMHFVLNDKGNISNRAPFVGTLKNTYLNPDFTIKYGNDKNYIGLLNDKALGRSKIDNLVTRDNEFYSKYQIRPKQLADKIQKSETDNLSISQDILNDMGISPSLEYTNNISPINKFVKENEFIQNEISKVRGDLTLPKSVREASDTSFDILNTVKKNIDDKINVAQRQGENELARRLIGIKDELKQKMIDAAPEYQKALDIYKGGFQFEEAYGQAKEIFNQKMTVNEFADMLNKMTANEKKAFKGGIKDELLNLIHGKENETLGWKKVVPDAVQNKIRLALGEKEGNKLIAYANREIRAMRNYNELLKGSQTAEKTALDKARHWKDTAADALTGWAYNGRNRGIADILTNPDVGYVEAFYQNSRNPQGWEAVYEALMNPNSRQAKYNAALSAYLTGQALKD